MLTKDAQYELLLEYVFSTTELREELSELRKLQATEFVSPRRRTRRQSK
jgi:hypothetical protein